ncbi:MAG: hypothetical protein KBC96_04885 [Armatimonadetes bacterium]|nr:hypothetical protein [Armatimonadota bacterium]
MKCANLKAYLDNQLNFYERLLMAAHVKSCASCRQNMAEWSGLSRDIERLEGEPVPPALRERVMADAMTAAASAQARDASESRSPRAQGVFVMKRALLVAAFAVVLVAVGFWLLPGENGDFALADMAQAMTKVQSVHFTGFSIDGSGRRQPVEGWVKGASKIRIRVNGIRDVADDGKRLVAIERDYLPKVTIRSTGSLQGLARGMTYLDLFSGPGALRSAVVANGAEIIGEKKETAAGREVLVTELQGDAGARMCVFTDLSTNLLVRSETYDPAGTLIECIERVEYDVPVNDSLFVLAIPDDLPVLDMISPSPEEILDDREAEFKRLQADPNASMLFFQDHSPAKRLGSCGSSFHPDFQFEMFGPGLVSIHYLADKNMYRVLGKVRAHSLKDGWRSDMVEDGYIRLAGEPQVEDVLMLDGKVGDYCKADRGVYRIENIGPGPATVTWHEVKKAFVIRGRATVLPTGRAYTNGVVELDIDHGHDIAEYVTSGGKLDWGNLPHSEIESMKADIDVAVRLARIEAAANGDGFGRIDGTEVTAMYGVGSQADGIKFSPAGPGRQIWVLYTQSTRQYHVLGRCRIDPGGAIVKNGIVSYDGKVLSSE